MRLQPGFKVASVNNASQEVGLQKSFSPDRDKKRNHENERRLRIPGDRQGITAASV